MIHVLDHNFQNVPNSIASFLIETNKKNAILVETGSHSSFETLKKEIERVGYDWKNIKHVFLTHIHLDHAGSAWAFAQNGATIYVHNAGAKHLIHPEKLMASAKQIYQEKMEMLWGEMYPIPENQVYSVNDNEIFEIDNITIKALHTLGHASHHIAWQMDNIVFTGDVAGIKIGNENAPIVAPLPPPDIDVEAWLHSIEILKNCGADTFYLTHFGKHQNIQKHLDELKNNILEYTNWIKEQSLLGKNQAEITQDFEIYIKKGFEKYNFTPLQLSQYLVANPPDMSVTGVLRYWKKRSNQ
jgi:glyoxylase-like metal-dependent hydrolase (beta-lactamase superfamily II)